ncbi:molybdopterin synthase catalytic subunit MoaE [Marinimicrobium sp. ABcell2]|uniref:molybdopterin synthase catalytic subunit MoaE n=1 Tax=Marinimicrobium sp. ABcell2 TaxID=3069751 RepID=UPI0027AE0209|nr:molybdopterin synthase catalytic subunit MoaE [Marinimicrobium sp. ABcell2]MDQ2077152.1 molybdopterin synthase catalytic subunit MoaE [Marinimicrobium sp. ABcell2]
MNEIAVQTQDFDVGAEYAALISGDTDAGAAVFFVGRVRARNDGREVTGLHLEHYPGMTEKSLQDIVQQAKERWPIERVRVIHRVGALRLGEQIVFVGATSPHRAAAFSAAEFIMDYLKTRAPFWKKEQTSSGELWVEARDTDQQSAQRW